MKKIMIAFAISISLLGFQACEEKTSETREEKTVTTAPAPVQSAFSAKYSTATDIKWEEAKEDGKDTYKAKFMIGGKKMKAEFDANGGFIKEEDDN